MPSKLGDCRYRHDWIDGKCNTCGQIADAPEAKSQGEDESTLRLKIKKLTDWIDAQGELKIRVAELETELRQTENKLQIESELHAAAGKWVFDLQTQLRQEREAHDVTKAERNANMATAKAWADAHRLAEAQVAQLQATISQLATLVVRYFGDEAISPGMDADIRLRDTARAALANINPKPEAPHEP